jgi:exodeoxyribonuclease V gamma subunit
VVVAELRDYINRGWRAGSELGNELDGELDGETDNESDKEQSAAEMLTVEYPLQPFSRHCFDGNPATASYAGEWLPEPISPAARSIAFSSTPLPPIHEETHQRQVDISQLVRFWNHPVRFFLEQRIGLRTWLEDDLMPESEAFSLDHLQKYLLAQEIVTDLRSDRKSSNKKPATPLYRLQAAGELPGGKFGPLLYQEMEESAAALIATLEPVTQRPAEPMEVRLTIDDMQITGWLSSLYGHGRITFRPATLKAKDILQLWIHHLILLLLRPTAVQPISIHAALDKIICFQEVDDPRTELAALLTFFQQGLSEPLHFYPKTSHAWAKAKSETAAWNAARRTWYSGYYKGEEEDPAYDIGLQGHEPLDHRFAELAGLFHPVLDSMGNGIG